MQTTTDRATQLRLVSTTSAPTEPTPTERWIAAIRRESPFDLVKVVADGPSVPLRTAHGEPAAA